MFRFLFRLIAVISLAVAVIMAVIDATRSIAASHWVATPLIESWRSFSPGTLAASEEFMRDIMIPEVWDPAIVGVLGLPGFALFTALSVLFYTIGRRRERPGRLATI